MDFKQIGMNILEDSVAVFASEALGIQQKLMMPGESELMRTVKSGLIWALLDEAVLLFKYGTSHLIEGHYYIFVDNAFFNTATWYLLSASGIGERVTSSVDGISPFGDTVNDALASGVMKVGVKTFQDIINNNWSATPLKYLTSVTTILGVNPTSEQPGLVQFSL